MGTVRWRHPGVRFVAFAPDGKSAVSVAFDHTIRLWDAATGRELYRWGGGRPYVLFANLSPDGRTPVLGCDDQTIRLRALATGRQPLHLQETGGWAAAALSPDGKTLAALKPPGTVVELRDAATGRLLRQLGEAAKERRGPDLSREQAAPHSL